MSILENVQKVFDEKKIYYFSAKNTEDNLLYVPYRGITDKNNRIDIYLEILEDLNIIRLNFIEELINKEDSVKSILLDLNASLSFGTLSLRNNSNLVEYRVDYQLNNNPFSFEQYQQFIICCINIYEKLKAEHII